MTTTPIDRLTALDRLMLGASARWPQDVGALVMLVGGPLVDAQGRVRMEVIRSELGARLHVVPRFRQVIHTPRWGLGGPLWVDVQRFDLLDHVRELRLDPPAGEIELLAAVERLRCRRQDPSRPGWEIWFLPGLADGRVGCFVRIHHTIADGMAAMLSVAALLDPGADTEASARTPAWSPRPWPTSRRLLVDNLGRRTRTVARLIAAATHPRSTVRHVAEAWPAIRELIAERPSTKTSFDRMVGPDRAFGIIRGRYAEVRAAGRAHQASVNDVLLAALAGGLRALLLHRGEPVRGTTLRVYVPVSLRRRLRGPQQGNLIAQMAVPLHLDEPDPTRRLRAISKETDRRKARLRTSLGVLMSGGRWMRQLMLVAVMRQRVNVETASLPGPRTPLYLAGARITEVFPFLPLIANESLGVGAFSYAGTWTIGITADGDGFPDLEVLVAAMHRELEGLTKTGVPLDGSAPPEPMSTGPAVPELTQTR